MREGEVFVDEIKLVMVREPRGSAQALDSPGKVYREVREQMQALDREHFWVILLDTRNCPIGRHVVSIGTINATLVSPREVYKAALLANAYRIVLVHNHPSGQVDPSLEDRQLTDVLVKAGKILDIEVLDHVIVGRGYFSFRETGLLKSE
jgi:DNA repair protein RadC